MSRAFFNLIHLFSNFLSVPAAFAGDVVESHGHRCRWREIDDPKQLCRVWWWVWWFSFCVSWLYYISFRMDSNPCWHKLEQKTHLVRRWFRSCADERRSNRNRFWTGFQQSIGDRFPAFLLTDDRQQGHIRKHLQSTTCYGERHRGSIVDNVPWLMDAWSYP